MQGIVLCTHRCCCGLQWRFLLYNSFHCLCWVPWKKPRRRMSWKRQWRLVSAVEGAHRSIRARKTTLSPDGSDGRKEFWARAVGKILRKRAFRCCMKKSGRTWHKWRTAGRKTWTLVSDKCGFQLWCLTFDLGNIISLTSFDLSIKCMLLGVCELLMNTWKLSRTLLFSDKDFRSREVSF